MKLFSTIIGILIISLMMVSCSKKETVTIPEYPGAIEDQEVKAKMFGMDFGGVRQVVTSDSFDTVFAFYQEQLRDYNPDIMFHTLKDGRQAAFTIMKTEKSTTTVAVQEFKKEGKVAISYMHVDMGM